MSAVAFPSTSLSLKYRLRYLRILSIVGFFTTIVLVPLHMFWGLAGNAVISAIYAAVCAYVMWALPRKPALAALLANLLIFVTVLATVGSTYFQSPDVATDPWVLVCPVVAFALTDRKTAARWTVAALASMFAIRFFQVYRPSTVSTILLAMSTAVSSVVLYLFSGLIEANEKLIVDLGNTDPLTNTLNRRALNEVLHAEFRRNLRLSTSMTLFMVDVDHFKQYNDRYGHVQGDVALVKIAGALKQSAQRSGDYVFRYGGEEFCMLCSGLEDSQATALAERLRINVEDLLLPHHDSPLRKVSVSVGYRHAESLDAVLPEDLISNADSALYHAKENGRNRTTNYLAIAGT